MTRKRKFPTNAKSHFKHAKYSDGGASKLEVGMQGVLVSHDRNREKSCRMDCFRLLNHFGDKLYGKEEIEDENQVLVESDGEDIEKALSTEVSGIKGGLQNKSLKKRRFFSVKSGCNNLIFVRFKGASPSELMKTVVESVFSCKDLENSDIPSIKNVLRVHPVEFSCPAHLDNMCKSVPPFIESKLSAFPDSGVTPKEYTIEYKCRNNSHLSRETVLQGLLNALRDSSSEWKYNCRSKSVSVIIDVLKTVCLVSVVRDYYKYRRYNIRELLLQRQKPDASPEGDSERPSEGGLSQNLEDEKCLLDSSSQIDANSEAANELLIEAKFHNEASNKDGPDRDGEQLPDASLSKTLKHEEGFSETVSNANENCHDSQNTSEFSVQTNLCTDATVNEEYESAGINTESVSI